MKTINNGIYDEIASTWWEQDGFMALLRTAINPPRFEYFREIVAERLALDPATLSVLDVGCGGGLLSEKFAEMGCMVTGIDRSLPTLDAARRHAQSKALEICYLEASAESLPFEANRFDVICCCDVLEHVDDIDQVIQEISRVLKPGGVFLFDTINRTLRSKLLAIKLAQDCAFTRLIPEDVHLWEKFIRPSELDRSLNRNALRRQEIVGLSFRGNPFSAAIGLIRHKFGKIGFAELGQRLVLGSSKDTSVSYMGYALRSLDPRPS